MALALLAGVIASELLCRSAAFRDLAGRLFGRGHLVAITNGKGIYETDLGGEEGTAVSDLIMSENLRHAAAKEVIDPARVERDVRFGYVSREAARRDYHVVLRDDGSLDADATAKARAAI